MKKVGIIVHSGSGNTLRFANIIKEELSKFHKVKVYRASDLLTRKKLPKKDAYFIGSPTTGKGILPNVMVEFLSKFPKLPSDEVYVFGTGDTQFGESHYCGAAYRIANYYNVTTEVGIVEQYPSGSQEVVARNWAKKMFGSSEISDGYHTMKELYYARAVLFATLCKLHPEQATVYDLHEDGTMYDDMFLALIKTPQGDFSYHIENADKHLFEGVKREEKAPPFDGHVSADVTRLFTL